MNTALIPLKNLIDFILRTPCPPIPGPNPCIQRKYEQVRWALENLPDCSPCIINRPVLAEIMNQGLSEVTLLESAIIMRDVPIVQLILQAGANPNITTAGVPLVIQLTNLAVGPGDWIQEQQIINILLNYGAWIPREYPGTRGSRLL